MSTTPMVKITIDGRELDVPQGSMIIEAADNAEITIPRFCYHKKLSVAANCRMCLVESSTARKPVPACATPVADGMVVQTKSPNALAYQKSVMEFLLINHPLDCPICDQGGECELQDTAMGYGKDVSRYNQGKRSVADHDIGPLIETDLTRCIQCTRCVRFGTEIAGMREMGMIGRGEHEEISTFMQKAVDSELSGNVIDLCPVGALTNKPFRYNARAWEMQQHPGVSPHDCIGSNLFMHVRRGEVMRAVPRENEQLNEVWLSDRDRYSVHALNNANRATNPLLKKKGKWVEVSWEEALDFVVDRLTVVKKVHGADKIASMASSSNTVEEYYLLQKLLRGIGTHNLDFRGHSANVDYQYDVGNFPGIDATLPEIADAECIVIFAGNLREEVPLLNHRIRMASLNGAEVFVFNPFELDLNYSGKVTLCNFAEMADILVHLVKEIVKVKPLPENLMGDLSKLTDSQTAKTWAPLVKTLLKSEKTIILAGQLLMGSPEASKFIQLMHVLRTTLNAKGGVITEGANSAGAWLAGYIPHRGAASKDLGKEGLSLAKMFTKEAAMKAFVLVNAEPGLDCIHAASANQALDAAEIVVSLSSFVTDYLKEHADVILPIAAFTETSGSFVNIHGEWQNWQGMATPKGEARPLWKVLRVLGNLFGLPGFDYGSNEDVLKELRAHLVHMKPVKSMIRIPGNFTKSEDTQRIGPAPIYSVDLLSRQAAPLQAAPATHRANFVGISVKQAQELNLVEGQTLKVTQGDQSLTLEYRIMDLADHVVYLPRATNIASGFGNAFGPITLAK